MNATSKWLFPALILLFLFVSVSTLAREATQKSIVPEQDRICNDKCKSYKKQPAEHEGCLMRCIEATKAKPTQAVPK
jgi:hypothetical protein